MSADSVAPLVAMMILAASLAPARALPVRSTLTTTALMVSPPFLLPVRHHGHRWHWRHRHAGWSGSAPPNGPAPEMDATRAPAVEYPPSISAQQHAPAPAQSPPDHGSKAAVPRPSIEWVNPDRAAAR